VAKTILVVDDDEAIRDLEELVLLDQGYSVDKADGGVPAIEYLKTRQPDLVLLDLLMPDVDGWGVLEFIATLAAPPRVVVVSGHAEIVPPGHLTHCVGGYVPKPFDLGQLTRTCKAVLAHELMVEPSGQRREARRTMVVQAAVLAEDDTPLLTAQVLNISQKGMGLELMMPFREGESVRLGIKIPGTDQLFIVRGRVAWRNESAIGLELEQVDDDAARLLRELIMPHDSGSRPGS
jgi:DNA-binding response OmpR family regulator